MKRSAAQVLRPFWSSQSKRVLLFFSFFFYVAAASISDSFDRPLPTTADPDEHHGTPKLRDVLRCLRFVSLKTVSRRVFFHYHYHPIAFLTGNWKETASDPVALSLAFPMNWVISSRIEAAIWFFIVSKTDGGLHDVAHISGRPHPLRFLRPVEGRRRRSKELNDRRGVFSREES